MLVRLTAAFTLLLAAPAVAEETAVVIGVDSGTPKVATVAVDRPQVALSGPTPITGMVGADVAQSVDVEPATGRVLMLGQAPGTPNVRLYELDPVTGVATTITSASDAVGAFDAELWDLDVNPVTGRAHAVGWNFDPQRNRHRSLDTTTGADPVYHPNPAYDASDPEAGTFVATAALAFTNSRPGATSTTAYAMDASALVRMGSPGGSPFPMTSSKLFSVAGTDEDSISGPVEALDVSPLGRPWALLWQGMATGSGNNLARIDLATGATRYTGLPVLDADVTIQRSSVVDLGATTATASEGGVARLPLSRTDLGRGPVTVRWTAEGADGDVPSGGTVTIPDGATSANLDVPIVDDPAWEGAETATIRLVDATGGPRGGAVLGTGARTATLQIAPSDAGPAASTPPAATPVAPLPAITRLRLSRTRFATRGRGAGTQLTFTLAAPGSVSATIERRIRGRRAKGRCVVKAKRGRRCTKFARVGAVRRDGVAGANRVAFDGRVAGRRLAPGVYRLTLVAADAAGRRSAPVRTTFTVIAAKAKAKANAKGKAKPKPRRPRR